MTAGTTGIITLEELEKDDFLQEVQSPQFSVQNHVTALLTSTTVNISSQIAALTQSLAKIDQAIHAQVSTNHGDLLAQTSNIEVMDNVVLSCSGRAKQCMENVTRVDTTMTKYEEELEKEIAKMERLYAIRSLLRKAERVAHLESLKDLTAAQKALVVAEIELICQDNQSFLKSSMEKASGLRKNIRKQTESMLSQALEVKSVLQVSSAVQILINLGVLDDVVEKTFADSEKAILKDMLNALTIKVQSAAVSKGPPGRAASVAVSASNQANQIWSNLNGLVAKISSSCGKVKLLWQVLRTNRDSDSSILYIKFLNDETQYWTHFWNKFFINFEKEFASSTEIVKSMFEAEYPKLLGFVISLSDSLEDCGSVLELVSSVTQLSIRQSLRTTILTYEKAYLSKSLSKLFDHVNHMFATSFPSAGDINNLIALFKQTIDASPDDHLKKLLHRNLSKTIHLVCVRCEGIVIVDGSATQVIGAPTQSQMTNAKIIELLEYFKSLLQPFQPLLSAEEVEGIQNLQKNTIWSLINAMADAIEAIILTIHQENWNRANRATEYSLYIGELQSFIARATKDYLSFNCPDLVQNCTSHLSSRTIDLLTRHAAIAPKLWSVRDQIVTDFSQLEIALSPLTPSLAQLGDSYKLLRGFKTLLQTDPKEFESIGLVPNVIPASLMLNVLFTLSDDKLLVAPHVARGWSPVRFSRWMDEKSETDKLAVIAATLNEYTKQVNASGRQEYSWTYPIMLSIIQRNHVQ